MKRYKCRLTTTHIDLDGDRMMLSALEGMVAQINTRYIPMGIEHDPRIPPMGRLISAEVVALDDGEFAVDGVVEMYEPDDHLPLSYEKEGFPFNTTPVGDFALQYDRGFRDEFDQELISELSEILAVQASPCIKKSLDPISVLTIGGGFVLGAVASGFLNRLGADAYSALKLKLKELFAHRREEPGESLLSIETTVESGGTRMVVEVLVTNPTSADIDQLLGDGLAQIDRISRSLFDTASDVPKVVCDYRKGVVQPRFGVRRDCVPLRPIIPEDESNN